MFTTPPGGGGGQRRWREGDGGSERRGVSPRRARAADVGPGQTPPPKRPAAYVQPGQGQNGPEMSGLIMANELYRQRDAIAALHTWVTSIHEATVDHAEQIEGAARHFSGITNEVQEMKQKLGVGLSTAEANLEGTFQKVDQIIAELKGGSAGTHTRTHTHTHTRAHTHTHAHTQGAGTDAGSWGQSRNPTAERLPPAA